MDNPLSRQQKFLIFFALFIFYIITYHIFVSTDYIDFFGVGPDYVFSEILTSPTVIPSGVIFGWTIFKLSAWIFLTPWPLFQAVKCTGGLECIIDPTQPLLLVFLFFVTFFLIKKSFENKKWRKMVFVIWLVYVGWGLSMIIPGYINAVSVRPVLNNFLSEIRALTKKDFPQEATLIGYTITINPNLIKQERPQHADDESSYQETSPPLIFDLTPKVMMKIYLKCNSNDSFACAPEHLDIYKLEDNNLNLFNAVQGVCSETKSPTPGYIITKETKSINPGMVMCSEYTTSTRGNREYKTKNTTLYKFLDKEQTILVIGKLGEKGSYNIEELNFSPLIPEIFSN